MPQRNIARSHDELLAAALRQSAVTADELNAAVARRPDVVSRAWANEGSARNSIRRHLASRGGLNTRSRDAIYALLDDVLAFRRDGVGAGVAEAAAANGSGPAPALLGTLEALPGMSALLLDGGKIVVTVEYVPPAPTVVPLAGPDEFRASDFETPVGEPLPS